MCQPRLSSELKNTIPPSYPPPKKKREREKANKDNAKDGKAPPHTHTFLDTCCAHAPYCPYFYFTVRRGNVLPNKVGNRDGTSFHKETQVVTVMRESFGSTEVVAYMSPESYGKDRTVKRNTNISPKQYMRWPPPCPPEHGVGRSAFKCEDRTPPPPQQPCRRMPTPSQAPGSKDRERSSEPS
ncbi:hypothetical protein Tb11.02.0720 [Trypanosoma brucei brucei TREU927]|uniref:Uncharacterized protein n=1 Tax=Trypanosoma brucei brucei (strain 927/4 GUTat10.1) TaxID=185431 RepID=Q386J0_TRYB2|nr:hypothetical protein Tb11.02.0720 [Trypanosoma brucei brucei TREU927]EAN79291.1 hypothetical protein Tb11.02.0720 [Trypanosoma brucei brucei TREU927]